METIILVLALAFIMVGLYGAWPMIRGETPGTQKAPRIRNGGVVIDRSAKVEKGVLESLQRQIRETAPAAAQSARKQPAAPPANVSLVGEVDFLRSQVEQLRSDLGSLAHQERRTERHTRSRNGSSRYRVGVYSSLSPVLRQQVQEARHTRVHV